MKTSNNKSRPLSQKYRQQLWYELMAKQYAISHERIENLFIKDSSRINDFTLKAAGLFLDFSRNLVDEEALQLLLRLAQNSQLKNYIDAFFKVHEVNNAEPGPVSHVTLRNNGEGLPEAIREQVKETYQKIESLVEKLHNQQWYGYSGKPVKDVVNISIGGADLGPAMTSLALTPYAQEFVNVHFVSSIDGTHLVENLKTLNPETTLFIISSRTFDTIEVVKNAQAARDWCLEHGMPGSAISQHFVAVSSNIESLKHFGIDENNIFPMWNWAGDGYSTWSTSALPVAIKVGMENFRAMLAGAGDMDEHFRSTEMRFNMPVIMGLLSVWYINFFGSEAQVVVPYDHYLRKLPAFLQQLEMQSNGKSVQRDGTLVDYHTMGAVFGEAGSNSQYAFHQLLHQGTHIFPVDFIVATQSHNPLNDQHTYLYSHCLSQGRALMCGRSFEKVVRELRQQGLDDSEIKELAPHKVIHGNKPSNTIVMKKLTPRTLGALIALYEHKVFVESIIWDIDAFEHWGGELGQQLSTNIFDLLTGDGRGEFDASTQQLIDLFRDENKLD